MIRANRSEIVAYARGVMEYRSDITRHYEMPNLLAAYDAGREMAHRITSRIYDND